MYTQFEANRCKYIYIYNIYYIRLSQGFNVQLNVFTLIEAGVSLVQPT